MSQNSNLIDALVADLKPVRPVRLSHVYGLWSVASLLAAGYFMQQVGLREDLAAKLAEWQFTLAVALSSLAFIGASLWCFAEAIPGRVNFRRSVAASALMAMWILSILFYSGIFTAHPPHAPSLGTADALGCCMRIAYGSLLPTAIMIFFVSYLSPLSIPVTVATGTAASVILVSVVSQLNCPVDDVRHALIGHGLMLIGVEVVSFAAAAWLGKWLHGVMTRYRARGLSTELRSRLR